MENESLCRCPVRPYYTPGSFGSGSESETALLKDWEAAHAHHPYAKARDEIAGPLQQAEGRVQSGEAVMDMVCDVMGASRYSERKKA